MKVELNQIFSIEEDDNFVQWGNLTKGRHRTPLNRFKGMPYFSDVNGRTPVINFHSNPFKEDEEHTPWRDLLIQDEGRVIYNGDNKNSSKKAHETFGNKQVLKVLNLYSSKKKEGCWRNIQTLDVDISDELQGELAEGQPLPTVGGSGGRQVYDLSHLDRENIARTMQLSGEEWLVIHKWATDSGMHRSMPGIALTLSSYSTNNWNNVPSAKQAKQAVKMIQQHKETIEDLIVKDTD